MCCRAKTLHELSVRVNGQIQSNSAGTAKALFRDDHLNARSGWEKRLHGAGRFHWSKGVACVESILFRKASYFLPAGIFQHFL